MTNDNIQNSPAHKAMAEAALEVLDTKFLRALCEPVRIEIIRRLITGGASDIATIAGTLSQDRSVVSRHLAALEQARITTSRKVGRQVFYDLDGPYITAKVQSILDAIAPMAELCKPFDAFDKAPNSGAA